MGKKQKKAAVIQTKVDSSESEADVEIKQEEDIKEEPSEPDAGTALRNTRARLIVRNLSFKASDEKVRKFFSPLGELTDLQILRKPDGRLVGCCFVEYALKTSAAKAIATLSGKSFLNRLIVVDWAVPKNKFIEKTHKTDDSEESGFHEDDDHKSKVCDEVKIETGSSDDESNESDTEEDKKESEDDGTSEAEEASDSDNGDEDDCSEAETDAEDNEGNLKPRKPLRESHDISEGCTVFVKNIPFSVDNQELGRCMHKFGAIYYALICMDPLTEHSKGTGFVKFKSKEAAEACLSAGRDGDIVLRGSVLETQPALSKNDLTQGSNKSNVKKDGRNLYLIKEGVILAGSPAASGVSQVDMAKRLQLEQWKTQMLKNLNKFVSRNRLVVQNLPSTYDENNLRALCVKYGGLKPVITEARVMRDFRNVDASGKGKSKEYGFVTFTSHDNALCALRALNNNPDIFSEAKRPIVAFSIEDKKALNIRHKRLEKSRIGLQRDKSRDLSQKVWERKHKEDKHHSNGPQQGSDFKGKGNGSLVRGKSSEEFTSLKEEHISKKGQKALKRKKFLEKNKTQFASSVVSDNDSKRLKFMGENAKQGLSGIMSRQKLREQAELQSKTSKSKNKIERKKKQLAAVKIRQPKQNMAAPKDLRREDNFSTLVDKYKTQLASTETERKKWYSS